MGELSKLARVSIRTLHHYDELGLLRPSARTEGNYRLYSGTDVERLHRILMFRELGLPLQEIRAVLDDPDADEVQTLKLQRKLLQEQAKRNQAMLDALDTLLAAAEGAKTMTDMSKEDLSKLFDGFDPAEYEQEAKDRWGETDAYKQSSERVKRYTKQDWEGIKAEMAAITAAYIGLMDAGTPPGSPEASAVVARHHAHQCRWYYDSSPEMFSNVSEMWVGDPRFTKNIDKARAGLAAYQYAAVQAWAKEQ
ncbi:MerR family transcriptional regulator [Deinococcus sp. Arct2-2]|uniref:MerR family transcriptional regulator n=1 Tax=Deinococcus sp. Arct2-2 TaxID=2568653 RepID=UPI0010A55183|nr:MerR family transcriptional regulator [Deinococcus sp. Arct2-2]THF69375.1 MerR family transcriptional regulator [Deinococcus sp. Arct2-2]